MKKVVLFLSLVIILTGCGQVVKEKEKINKDDKKPKYVLVSTEDRLVFKNGNNYEIIYYENEKIVKVESAIKFASEAEAKKYYLEESYGSSDIINYVYDVFIVLQTEDYWEDFKNLTKEELKAYLKASEFEYIA